MGRPNLKAPTQAGVCCHSYDQLLGCTLAISSWPWEKVRSNVTDCAAAVEATTGLLGRQRAAGRPPRRSFRPSDFVCRSRQKYRRTADTRIARTSLPKSNCSTRKQGRCFRTEGKVRGTLCSGNSNSSPTSDPAPSEQSRACPPDSPLVLAPPSSIFILCSNRY